MSRIMDLVIETTKEYVPYVIGLSGLGGRICYSSDSVDEIITNDKRLSNGNELINYLKRLITKGHLSIFEHSVLRIDKKEFTKRLMDALTLHQLLLEISPEIKFLFDTIGYDDLSQKFPVFRPDKELEGFYVGGVLALKRQFHILPYTNNAIYINMRHILEYKHKQLGSWDKVGEWFVDRYRDVINDSYTISTLQPLFIKEINNGQGRLTIFRLYNDGDKVVGATFVLEGVSRILTHQLVRHRLFSSYSQRSHRYTKINGLYEFVYPPLDYIKLKTIQTKLKSEFEDAYKTTLDKYEKLVGGIENKKGEVFKVRKEDARFIIPNGVKTTIMVTMLVDGFYNFLHERTTTHAQWEIREVAKILDGISKGEVV